MDVNRKVKVKQKTTSIAEISNQVLELEYNSDLVTIADGQKVRVVVTPEPNEELLNSCKYAMSGIEIESLTPKKEGMKCISFGGLLGHFSMKDPTFRKKWWVYLDY